MFFERNCWTTNCHRLLKILTVFYQTKKLQVESYNLIGSKECYSIKMSVAIEDLMDIKTSSTQIISPEPTYNDTNKVDNNQDICIGNDFIFQMRQFCSNNFFLWYYIGIMCYKLQLVTVLNDFQINNYLTSNNLIKISWNRIGFSSILISGLTADVFHKNMKINNEWWLIMIRLSIS